MYQASHKSQSKKPTGLKNSQLTPDSDVQAQKNCHKPLTPSLTQKKAIEPDSDKLSWVQRIERASQFGHNIANIPISSPHKQGSAIQTKLTIGEPGDKYEREADSVAEKVVNQIDSPQFQQQMQAVQHHEQSEESLHAKPSHDNLQSPFLSKVQPKATSEEPKAELPAKSIIQRSVAITGQNVSTDFDFESELNSAKGKGKPLDADLQRSMGQAMGADFSKVKIHTDAQSDQLNRSINSRAFATGNDVFVRRSESNLRNRKGKRLLAHELTHVVQQNGAQIQSAIMPSRAEVSMIQRFSSSTVDNTEFNITDNRSYLIKQLDQNPTIYARSDAPAPRWSDSTDRQITIDGNVFIEYRPRGKFFSDCLHTAEEIMHQKPLRRGYTRSRIKDQQNNNPLFGRSEEENWEGARNVPEEQRDNNANANVGEAFSIVQEEDMYEQNRRDNPDGNYPDECKYHAAAVVAQDGQDRITLELFGDTTKQGRTDDAKYALYNTNPDLKNTFHQFWSEDFTNGITVSLIPK